MKQNGNRYLRPVEELSVKTSIKFYRDYGKKVRKVNYNGQNYIINICSMIWGECKQKLNLERSHNASIFDDGSFNLDGQWVIFQIWKEKGDAMLSRLCRDKNVWTSDRKVTDQLSVLSLFTNNDISTKDKETLQNGREKPALKGYWRITRNKSIFKNLSKIIGGEKKNIFKNYFDTE